MQLRYQRKAGQYLQQNRATTPINMQDATIGGGVCTDLETYRIQGARPRIGARGFEDSPI